MKLTATKPFSLNGRVVGTGQPFETLEQHGRQLLRKGLATKEQQEISLKPNPSRTLVKKTSTSRRKRSG